MSIWDKIEDAYWTIVPYEWRPGTIWHKLKCFFWHRYSTVKARYMDHDWANRDELMAHMMFEILAQFIEKECTPEIIEWYGEWGRKVVVVEWDGSHHIRYVRDEMQALYDWWHQVYIKEYQEVSDMLWAEAEKHPPVWNNFIDPECIYHFDSEEDRVIYTHCVKSLNNLDEIMLKALEARLRRLLVVRHYLST